MVGATSSEGFLVVCMSEEVYASVNSSERKPNRVDFRYRIKFSTLPRFPRYPEGHQNWEQVLSIC